MEVRILSLGGQTVSVSAGEITTHTPLTHTLSNYQTPDSQQPVDGDEQTDVLSRQAHGGQDQQHGNQSSTGDTGSSNTGQGGSHTGEENTFYMLHLNTPQRMQK